MERGTTKGRDREARRLKEVYQDNTVFQYYNINKKVNNDRTSLLVEDKQELKILHLTWKTASKIWKSLCMDYCNSKIHQGRYYTCNWYLGVNKKLNLNSKIN